MRFSCDSCQARYTIADEKVRGKILRVRCKRCGNAILIKEPDEVDEATPAAEGDESTRVVPGAEVRRAIAEPPAEPAKFVSRSSQAPAPARAAPPPRPPGEKKEWYAIVAGKEVGPMTRPELAVRAQQGEVSPRTYVWHDGMPQWQRLRDVAALAELVRSMPPPPGAGAASQAKTTLEANLGHEIARQAEELKARLEAKKKADDEAAAKAKADAEAAQRDAAAKAEAAKRESDAKAKEAAKRESDARAEAAKRESDAKAKAESDAKAKAEADAKARATSALSSKAPAAEVELDDEETTDHSASLDELFGEEAAKEPEAPAAAEAPKLEVLADELAQELEPEAAKESAADAPIAPEPAKTKPEAEATGLTIGGAAADPFAAVPDAPGFHQPAPGETTNAIIKASGAKEKRWGRTILALAAMVLALGGAVVVGLKSAGKIDFTPAPAAKKVEKSSIDWTKVQGGLDQGADDILSGAAKKKAADDEQRKLLEAQRAAEAKKRAANELAGLIPPPDVDDTAVQVKQPKEQQVAELTPEQMALFMSAHDTHHGDDGPKPLVVDKDLGGPAKKDAAGGGPDQQVVAQKIGEAHSGLENCISNALRRDPSLHIGKVTITATIGSSGLVTKAVFDRGDIGDTDVGQCLRKVVKTIVFPAFDGDPTDVEIPLTIGSAG